MGKCEMCDQTFRATFENRLRGLVDTAVLQIHPYYVSSNWKWTNPEPAHVPTEDELRKCLHMLIDDLMAYGHGRVSTGGLCVWADSDANECGINFTHSVISFE